MGAVEGKRCHSVDLPRLGKLGCVIESKTVVGREPVQEQADFLSGSLTANPEGSISFSSGWKSRLGNPRFEPGSNANLLCDLVQVAPLP